MAVEQRGVGTVAQQQGTDLHSVLGRRLVQRSKLPQVHGVDAGAMLKEKQKTKDQEKDSQIHMVHNGGWGPLQIHLKF